VSRTSHRGRTLGVLGIVVVGVLAVALWPALQSYVGVRPPAHFYADLEPAFVPSGTPVLGVAHNAGNNPSTTAAALAHGAAVIEIDVVSAGGRLVAGRDQPLPRVAGRMFRGYSLEEMWTRAEPARVIKLDLKATDRTSLDSLVLFLRPRLAHHEVMVSSGDAASIAYLHPRLPSAVLLFSAGWPDELAAVRANPELVADIGGVSVFHGLVDPALVDWMHQRRLLVLVWTVNDGQRLNEVVRDGVDGVTTANLAILRALSEAG